MASADRLSGLSVDEIGSPRLLVIPSVENTPFSHGTIEIMANGDDASTETRESYQPQTTLSAPNGINLLKRAKLAAAATLSLALAACGVPGNSNQSNPDNSQPQNGSTETVPSSATSEGVFKAATQPVSPEQPKPTPTLAPGIGGTSIERFADTIPNAAELNKLIDDFNSGKTLSNEQLNMINTSRAKQAETHGKEETKTETIPCTIVSPELCIQAERIEKLNPRGDLVTYIGLSLPSGTEIFSPIDGQVAKVKIPAGASLKGFETSIRDLDSGSGTFYITGDLIFPNELGVDEKKGALIGTVGDRGIQNLGNFNVVITAGRPDPSKGYAVSDIDALESLFPNAFKKPSKTISNTETNNQYFGGNVYIDKK